MPDQTSAAPRNGAAILADALHRFDVPVVTFIPGEGILELVDALATRAPSIRLASFRHEAGMAYAAQAIGQLSGQPGVCLAARAPGALNTTLAIHTAYTDSAPMIMIVGQADMHGAEREAMLGVSHFHQVFGPLTKWVGLIESAQRIPEMLARAWHIAMSGRRGPVVLVLPENVSRETADVADLPRPLPTAAAPAPQDMTRFTSMLAQARKPFLIVGGTGWRSESLRTLTSLARANGLPVATTYRRRDLVDHDDANFAGEIGLGIDRALAARIAQADLVVMLNGRLGELNTVGAGAFAGFTLWTPPKQANALVHVHPEAAELNAAYRADLAIPADANAFVEAWVSVSQTRESDEAWVREARAERLAYIESGTCPGPLDLRAVYALLDETLAHDTLVTSGAGAYATWPQRYLRHRRPNTQLGPKSGAMGYGLPAGIAAALLDASRRVVAIAGDGCFMMHAEELETAQRLGVDLLMIVVNNSAYGAIDSAQRRQFGRTTGTALGAIDFAAFAQSFGVPGETVETTDAFAPALHRALASGGVRLIELRVPSSVTKPVG
ncbi:MULTISPECIES: thiamine pyrophosphate-dependent enzyme [unclassified Caballeronia]|uniref:thiamine pyrophosphate-dependent enzyme n=1 Tax=unclassified Caballeronia TaxID=2646786 RepID=UPI00286154C7|nr:MULTISPECIES: thiamine pyrophosphate-dependent enzyme [unclassified Caballeronia]MDR5776452.1 thiamine pyrophosphate-binding protein [Caballeronia sp. LZ002]MDR5851766.1 thiamine pyrophosphate-binding protein [Caballeronia sp. LZ003]